MFQDYRNLKNLLLPEGLKTIGEDCFWNSGLEEIIFPASVKEVGARAFYKCEHLRRVLLGEELEKLSEKEVGGGKYKGPASVYSKVKDIMLLSALKTVEVETFSWCENLKRIDIPSGVEYIGERCLSDSGIEEIALPSTLKEIDENAFKYCPNLKTVFAEEGCTVDVRKFVGEKVEVRQK